MYSGQLCGPATEQEQRKIQLCPMESLIISTAFHVWSGRLWYGYVTFIYVDAFYAHVQCTTLYTPYARASRGVTLVLLNTAEMQFSALKWCFSCSGYFHWRFSAPLLSTNAIFANVFHDIEKDIVIFHNLNELCLIVYQSLLVFSLIAYCYQTYLYASRNPPFLNGSFSILNSTVVAVKDHPTGSKSKDLSSIKVMAFVFMILPGFIISDTDRLLGYTLMRLGDKALVESFSGEVDVMGTLKTALSFLRVFGVRNIVLGFSAWSC